MDSTQEQAKVPPKGNTKQGGNPGGGGRHRADTPAFEAPPSGPPELIMLKAWIRENQTAALAGAFAVGSLIGFWLKR